MENMGHGTQADSAKLVTSQPDRPQECHKIRNIHIMVGMQSSLAAGLTPAPLQQLVTFEQVAGTSNSHGTENQHRRRVFDRLALRNFKVNRVNSTHRKRDRPTYDQATRAMENWQ